MTTEKFNPFNTNEDDLVINTADELAEAKSMAGVVTEQEHIMRLLESGDKKLVQHAVEQMGALHRKEIAEKDAEIQRLQEMLGRIQEITGKGIEPKKGEFAKQLLYVVANTRDMSQEEFDAHHKNTAELVRDDDVRILDTDYVLGPLTEEMRTEYNIRMQKLLTATERGQRIVVVDGKTYILGESRK